MKRREFTGKARWAFFALAAAWTVFQLWTEATATLPLFAHRSIHLAFGLPILFLLFPVAPGKTKGKWLALDIGLALIALAVMARHIITGWDVIPPMQIAEPNARDMTLAVLFILLCLEASRRTIGWALVIVAAVAIAYAFLGPWVPGPLQHPGMSMKAFLIGNFMTEQGTFGLAMSLSSGILFAVIAFGAFLTVLGGGELFIKVAMALTGRYRGGPAKVAVVASAFFGTISGSSVANVAGTGVFTIPLMKKLGYKPEFAGAVEACASTGGQIMPPVMGIAAFVMVEFLEIPYGKLIFYAAIPAVFYFATVFMQVHLEALKTNLRAMTKEELPKMRDIPWPDWILLFPVGVFFYYVAVKQLSVGYSAFFATVGIWISFVIRELIVKRGRVDLKQLLLSFERAPRQMMEILGSLVMVGVIIYCVEVTGLGTKLSMALIDVAGANVILLLIMTMFASLILGIALPSIACYIFLAVLAAPALVQIGILPLAAHMFVFWFGIVSGITPPVGTPYYVAAGIAGAEPQKTGWRACKLGIAGYVVPYAFALSPSLLLQGGSAVDIVRDVVSLLVAAFGLAVAVEGWFVRRVPVLPRLAFGAAGLVLVLPGTIADIIGYAVLALLIVMEVIAARKTKRAEMEAGSESG